MPKAYEFNVRVLPMGLFACRFLEDQTIMYIHDGSQLGVLVFTQNKPRLLILENVFWQYFKNLLSWFSKKLKSKLGEGVPQGGLNISLSLRFFAIITLKNCLKFMFRPSLPNHSGCWIDHSHNNAIFSSKSRFNALKYFE